MYPTVWDTSVIPPSTVSHVKPPAGRNRPSVETARRRCETAAPGTWTNFELGACPWTQGSVCKERRESTDTGRQGERIEVEDGILYILPCGDTSDPTVYRSSRETATSVETAWRRL